MIHRDGYAVTCAHVVEGAEEIYVRIGTQENSIEKAKVININKEVDIAVLKLEGVDHYAAFVGLEEEIEIGDEIIILGYPFGAQMSDDVMQMSASFTRGYVSSIQKKNDRKRALLDISAKAGNSGSPVISIKTGSVIGVLSGSVVGGVNNREEVNYMIPIAYLNLFLSE